MQWAYGRFGFQFGFVFMDTWSPSFFSLFFFVFNVLLRIPGHKEPISKLSVSLYLL